MGNIEFAEILSEPEGRFDRHYLIEWWDQKMLKEAKVLVAGAGALGNEVLKNLALIGVGNITIIDFDTVSITNLTRSVLFRESDVNLPKVEVARQRLLEINPEININVVQGDLEFDLGVGDVKEHNIIIGCLDSINARWVINQLAYRAKVPWINAGIGVAEGEVSFFDPQTDAACYQCTISAPMWEHRNQRYSCQGLKRNIPEQKIPTIAPIASIAAAIQVHQALLYLHGKTGLLEPGEKVFLSLNPWTPFKVHIQRSQECIAHDLPIEPTQFFPNNPDLSVQEILQQLEDSGFSQPVMWLRNEVISTLKCPECNYQEPVHIPIKKLPEEQLICPQCSQESRDFEILRDLTLQQIDDSIKLGELCLGKNEILHCDTDQGRIAIKFYQI